MQCRTYNPHPYLVSSPSTPHLTHCLDACGTGVARHCVCVCIVVRVVCVAFPDGGQGWKLKLFECDYLFLFLSADQQTCLWWVVIYPLLLTYQSDFPLFKYRNCVLLMLCIILFSKSHDLDTASILPRTCITPKLLPSASRNNLEFPVMLEGIHLCKWVTAATLQQNT